MCNSQWQKFSIFLEQAVHVEIYIVLINITNQQDNFTSFSADDWVFQERIQDFSSYANGKVVFPSYKMLNRVKNV